MLLSSLPGKGYMRKYYCEDLKERRFLAECHVDVLNVE
jgi:hypothetical protein